MDHETAKGWVIDLAGDRMADPALREDVQAHVSGCEECASIATLARDVEGILRDEGRTALDPDPAPVRVIPWRTISGVAATLAAGILIGASFQPWRGVPTPAADGVRRPVLLPPRMRSTETGSVPEFVRPTGAAAVPLLVASGDRATSGPLRVELFRDREPTPVFSADLADEDETASSSWILVRVPAASLLPGVYRLVLQPAEGGAPPIEREFTVTQPL